MNITFKYRGFSLIEIVIALGIIGFCVVAIMGLMPTAFKGGQFSLNETVIAIAARQVVSSLRQHRFSEIPNSASVGIATTANPVSDKSTLETIYFDVNGIRVQDSAGADITDPTVALSQGAVYRCTVRAQGDVEALVPEPEPKVTGGNNLLRIELEFNWPLSASVSKPTNSLTIHASISKYY